MDQEPLYEICRVQLVKYPLSHSSFAPHGTSEGFSQHTQDSLAMEGNIRIGAKSGTNPAM
jgi:hypothetical protein